MLPPEILLLIFGFLESEPFELISCCTAHPFFAQIIEPALYRNVVVHNMPPTNSGGAIFRNEEDGFRLSPPELSHILSNSPHVVRYLHGLTIELFNSLDSDTTRHISSILHKLRPSCIILSGMNPWGPLDWNDFPVQFARVFVGSISNLHTREVSIVSVSSVPPSTFRNCKGLRSLKLYHGSTSSIELQQASPIPDYPLLEHLEINRWHSDQPSVLISWLKPRIINLRSLTLKTPDFDEPIWRRNNLQVSDLLPICPKTLVELDIDFHSGKDFDFSSLKSLKRLKISKYTRSGHIRDANLIRVSILPILPTLETAPPLNLLVLSLGLRFKGRNIAGVDWSPLANYLPSVSSKFQNIELHITAAARITNFISFDEIFVLLTRYDNLMAMVDDGVLSIKPGEFLFPS